MRKFWVRPDGNDEEAEEKFNKREKIAMIGSIILLVILLFVVFPWWDKKTDEYWRQEAMRSQYNNYVAPVSKDTTNAHPFREN